MNLLNKTITQPSFKIKGRAYTLPILEIITHDIEKIDQELTEKIKHSPNFFKATPIILDLNKLDMGQSTLNIQALIETIEKHSLVILGVNHTSSQPFELAKKFNLKNLEQLRPGTQTTTKEPKQNNAYPIGKIINQTIRSGQQIVTPESDLIITKSVSAGAELMANGNIIVIGALRGKAMAGIHGNVQAAIVCQSLQAELISIAGIYKTCEQYESFWGQAVQIKIDNQTLKIEKI